MADISTDQRGIPGDLDLCVAEAPDVGEASDHAPANGIPALPAGPEKD